MLKRKKSVVAALLAIAGGAYFSAYSSLNQHFLLSAWVILLIQAGACFFLIYAYWNGYIKGTSRYQKQRHEHEP